MKIYWAAGLFLVAAMVLLGILSLTPLLETLELKNYDLMMYLRGSLAPPEDVLIVAIDQTSLDEFARLGLSWPWPRAIYGELVQILSQQGAKVIIFDVVFDVPSANSVQDAAFAQAVVQSRMPVVLAAHVEYVQDARFNLHQEVLPIDPLLEAGGHYGFATFNSDLDTVVRRARLTVGGEATLATRTHQELGGAVERDRVPVVLRGRRPGDPDQLRRHGPIHSDREFLPGARLRELPSRWNFRRPDRLRWPLLLGSGTGSGSQSGGRLRVTARLPGRGYGYAGRGDPGHGSSHAAPRKLPKSGGGR